MAKLIDGKLVSSKIRLEISQETAEFIQKTGIQPHLVVIIVGNDAASMTYVKNKKKACEYIGVESLSYELPEETTEEELLDLVKKLNADEKVFVVGHASVEDDKDGKIICERIVPFDETGCDLWLQFATKEEYAAKEQVLMDILYDSDGSDEVVIYVANPKALKRLGKNQTIGVNEELLQILTNFLGENNVKVVEKSIE